MMDAPAPGARTASPHRPVNRWIGLIFDHVLPGTLFAVIAYAQLYAVFGLLQGSVPASGPEADVRGWSIAQRCMSAVFFLLAAYLFTVRAPRRGSRTGLLGAVVALGGTFALTFIGLLPPVEPSPERTIPSLVLMIVGITFGVFSLLCLGRCFGMFPEARGLVTNGPYRYIRHPLYLAEIISAAGLILGSFSPWTLALFVLFVSLQYARAILEERALAQSLPDYTAYAAQTWRILPGIH
jgi:protein-S-isoprenylcysteine O-methyltransferase Ste14